MRRIGLTLRVDEARERRDCIDQAWYRVLADIELWPVLLPNMTHPAWTAAELLDELCLSGVILTGGNDLGGLPGARTVAPERDRFEAALLDACAARRTPVLGVCRGLQKIAQHHGGTPTPVRGHVATRHRLEVIGKPPFPLTDRSEVNSFHDYALTRDSLPDTLAPLAVAGDGTVEALGHVELPQWAIMWHPERAPEDPADRDLLRALFARG